jgi:hypothetical protein
MSRIFLGSPKSGATETLDYRGRSSYEGGEGNAMVVTRATMAWRPPMDMGEGQ